MNKAAVYHVSTDSWCYAIDDTTLHIRMSTAADDVDSVELWAGDPHDWIQGTAHGRESGAWEWHCVPVPMRKSGSDGIRDWWEAFWAPPYRRARYFFRLRSGGECVDFGEEGIVPRSETDAEIVHSGPQPAADFRNAFVFPYINPADVFRVPSWVQETVWYQVFPDRFRNGNEANDPPDVKSWTRGPVTNHDLYGGDLAGIREGLDHIASLGCNGIYLTPIFASPSVHKYDTSDYMRIDPAFGTDEELKSLVRDCHERGMRVMLDAVFNHCGSRFDPWLDVLEKGELSPYAGWFRIRSFPLFPRGKDPGDSRKAGFETFAFTTRMPKFDTENKEAREYLLSTAERYLRDFDIDGWRLDVAGEVDRVFWREFRQRVKAAKPDAYILGEIWHDAMPWLRGDQYDAVMNYPAGNAVSDFVLAKPAAADAATFAGRLARLANSRTLQAGKASFLLLDSHDTERLAHRFGGSRERGLFALALLFTLPGTPCVYYGTEYAMEGGPDPDNRRCMIWHPTEHELSFAGNVRALVGMRRRLCGVLNEGSRRAVCRPDFPGLYAEYVEGGSTRLLFIANRGPETASKADYFSVTSMDAGWKAGFSLGTVRGGELPGEPPAAIGPNGFVLFERG